MADTSTLTPTPPLLTDAELRLIDERNSVARLVNSLPYRSVEALFNEGVPRLLADHARLRAYLHRLVECERGEGDLLELVGEVRAVLEESKNNDR